jgi:hypothetical protein
VLSPSILRIKPQGPRLKQHGIGKQTWANDDAQEIIQFCTLRILIN